MYVPPSEGKHRFKGYTWIKNAKAAAESLQDVPMSAEEVRLLGVGALELVMSEVRRGREGGERGGARDLR